MAVQTIGNMGVPPPRPPRTESTPPAPAVKKTDALAADAPAPVPEPPKTEAVQKAVEELRQRVETKAPNSLQFSVDEATGKTVIKITDAVTGETIRQIPAEELLRIAQSLDKLQGMLLKQEA